MLLSWRCTLLLLPSLSANLFSPPPFLLVSRINLPALSPVSIRFHATHAFSVTCSNPSTPPPLANFNVNLEISLNFQPFSSSSSFFFLRIDFKTRVTIYPINCKLIYFTICFNFSKQVHSINKFFNSLVYHSYYDNNRDTIEYKELQISRTKEEKHRLNLTFEVC